MKETYIFRFRDLEKVKDLPSNSITKLLVRKGMFGGDGGQNLVRCFHHKN